MHAQLHTETYIEGPFDKDKYKVLGRSNLSQVKGLYVDKFRNKPLIPCISFSMYVILITRFLNNVLDPLLCSFSVSISNHNLLNLVNEVRN